MASIFKHEPIFSHERPWDDATKLPEKYKFSGTSRKAEVHMDSGSLGMEVFYEKTDSPRLPLGSYQAKLELV
jgi:hypothetical protein